MRLQVHNEGLPESTEEMFVRIYRELRPRAAMPKFRVEFRRFANANSFISLENRQISVRISDALENAPASVIEALGFILLAKLYRKPIPPKYPDRYRRYLNRRDISRRLDLMRQERGRKVLNPPQGERYDLDQIFEELNLRFFHGLMARPEMGWSKRGSRTTLGHYDSSHNVIVISKYLDREEVPKLAVEYVVFHEMLHLRFPTEHTGTRRRIHTKDFKKAEKEFPRLAEALELLKKL